MWKINKWEGSNKKGRGLTKKKKINKLGDLLFGTGG